MKLPFSLRQRFVVRTRETNFQFLANKQKMGIQLPDGQLSILSSFSSKPLYIFYLKIKKSQQFPKILSDQIVGDDAINLKRLLYLILQHKLVLAKIGEIHLLYILQPLLEQGNIFLHKPLILVRDVSNLFRLQVIQRLPQFLTHFMVS